MRTFLAMRAPGVIMTPVGADACELLYRHGSQRRRGRPAARGRRARRGRDRQRARRARRETAHLLRAGHRRVALLVADTNWTSDVGRLAGYRQAHDEAGLPVDERLIARVAFHAPDAEQLIVDLLGASGRPRSAAANNLLAEQAWRLIRERGLRLPEDVSVGFDDVPWMEMVSPGITVVAQPTEEPGVARRSSSCAGSPTPAARTPSNSCSRRWSCGGRPGRRFTQKRPLERPQRLTS